MHEDQQPNGTKRPTSQEVTLLLVIVMVIASTRDAGLQALLLEWLLRGLKFSR